MSSPEHRLRDALQAHEPAPLDPERIIRAARHRRVVGRARIGVAAAVVVVAGAIGVPLAVQLGQNQAADTAAAPEATGAPDAAAPAGRPSATRHSVAARPGTPAELIPGRTLRVEAERWCLLDLTGRTAPECVDRTAYSQRATDDQGTEWLVVVAPSGPGTALLQVAQPRGWVNLQTSRVPGSDEHWTGVTPSAQASEAPGRIRALDGAGAPVWSAD